MTWRSVLPAACLLLLGLSAALSVLAARYDTLPGDVDIAAWAQDQPLPGEPFSDFVRAITTTQAVLVVGTGAVALLALLGRRREAVLLGVGLIVLPVLQSGLKELVDRPRPVEPLVELRGGFTSPSFPAGHVMSPTYLYGFLFYVAVSAQLPRFLRVSVACWSAFVLVFAGPPNVWLGVHWPSDVLAGWAWALVLLLPLVFVHRTLGRAPT